MAGFVGPVRMQNIGDAYVNLDRLENFWQDGNYGRTYVNFAGYMNGPIAFCGDITDILLKRRTDNDIFHYFSGRFCFHYDFWTCHFSSF